MIKSDNTCSRCGIKNDGTNFRIRIDKRCSPVLVYYNSTCRECDRKYAEQRYKRLSATKEGRAMFSNHAKTYHKRHRDECLAYMKKKRESDHGKKYRKEYDERNKKRISELSVLRNRKYVRDIVANIKPTYIVRNFSHPRVGVPSKVIRQYPELIEAYRTYIAIKRFLKTKNNPQWKISYNSERLC